MNEELQTEDRVLDYTQAKREEVIKAITKGGEMPDDPKALYVVLATLDGMDRAALAKKKLKNDAEVGSKVGLASAAITELLSNLRNETKNVVPVTVETKVIEIPESIPDVEVVPGELDTVDPGLDYNRVMTED